MATETSDMASASRSLGLNLLTLINESPNSRPIPSTVCSPLSVTVAIGMLAGAADGTTKRDLCRSLGIDDAAQLSQSFTRVLSTLGTGDAHGPVASANAVFTDRDTEVYQRYRDFLRAFDADITQYGGSLAENAAAINTWVSDNTRGLITDLLSAGALENAHVVLVNALAFKGTWKQQFDKAETKKVPFHLGGGGTAKVDMMFQRDVKLASAETDEFRAIRIPYAASSADHATSLVAYLPNEGSDLRQLISHLQLTNTQTSVELIEQKFDLFGLPKFSLDTKAHILEPLSKLGFPLSGNFPEMGSGRNEVSDVIHQAVIKVDEEGTEAAAATAVIMFRSMVVRRNNIILDRPFYFELVHDQSRLVLFTGTFSGA